MACAPWLTLSPPRPDHKPFKKTYNQTLTLKTLNPKSTPQYLHVLGPFPGDKDKKELAARTGLTRAQVA